MKLAVVLSALALLAAACGSSAPTPPPDSAADGASDGASDAASDDASDDAATYAVCPQHRVEGFECPSATATDGVRRKGGLICATCKSFDSTGQPGETPVGCTTIAGGDLCVADCGECT